MADGGRVIVAGNAELFDQSKFRTKCEKLKLTAEAELSCSPETLGRCLKYTVLAKLAPEWNKVGEWLFNGRQFLHNALQRRINSLRQRGPAVPIVRDRDTGDGQTAQISLAPALRIGNRPDGFGSFFLRGRNFN